MKVPGALILPFYSVSAYNGRICNFEVMFLNVENWIAEKKESFGLVSLLREEKKISFRFVLLLM